MMVLFLYRILNNPYAILIVDHPNESREDPRGNFLRLGLSLYSFHRSVVNHEGNRVKTAAVGGR